MREKKPTPMCKYRIDLLEAVGFEWRLAPEQKTPWEDRFAALDEFRKENDHCNVPQAYPKNVALGKWVSKQVCPKCSVDFHLDCNSFLGETICFLFFH